MNRFLFGSIIVSGLVLGMSASAARGQEHFEKLAPYTNIRWNDKTPEVYLDDTWYELVSIDDVAVAELVAFCEKSYQSKWQKRFDEDLVQVLSESGRRAGKTVKLVLREGGTGKTVTRDRVSMTRENRHAIMDAKYNKGKSTPPPVSIPLRGKISPTEAADDLRYLQTLIEELYSYRDLRNFDYRKAIEALREKSREGIDTSVLAIEVQRIIAGFEDGHSRVRGMSDILPAGYLPFAVDDLNGRLVAFDHDNNLLDPERPFVRAIDDKPIDQWLEKAAMLSRGSAQFTRMAAIERLVHVQWLRGELGIDRTAEIKVELESLDGQNRATISKPVSDRPHRARARDLGPTRIVGDNIGYLRIASMEDDKEFLESLDQSMQRFKDTKALIIDVRGNGGGSRAALRTLFPYFLSPEEKPVVTNIAAYRLTPDDRTESESGYLANRWLFPQSYNGWTEPEADVVKDFSGRFAPVWQPKANEFSAWHYFVLSRGLNPKAYHYQRPILVLMDQRCFSATDIFLASFKGRPNVTLLGTPSGGGSGRAVEYQLNNSGLKVMLSSMASFRPDGRLYDGAGVEPDINHTKTLDDVLGLNDSLLDQAIERASKK